MPKQYNIVFNGRIVLGYHIQDVKNEFAARFKLTPAAVDQLFTKRQILRKMTDQEAAKKFVNAMEKIGALCEIEDADQAKAAEARAEKNGSRGAGRGQIVCPKCGFEQRKANSCIRCGVLINKFREPSAPAVAVEPEPPAEPEEPPEEQPFQVQKPPEKQKKPAKTVLPSLALKQLSKAIEEIHEQKPWLFPTAIGVILLGIIAYFTIPVFIESHEQAVKLAQPAPLPTARPAARAEDAVLKPTFSTEQADIRTGAAFIVYLPENNYYLLVTAYRLFSPEGGFAKKYRWDYLAGAIKNVKAVSVGNPSKMILTSDWLLIRNAAASTDDDGSQDISAFYLIGDFGMGSLQFVENLPNMGDQVWLVAETPEKGNQYRFPATITEVNEKIIKYTFSSSDIDRVYTIGAPIINSESRVVAINTRIILQNGRLTGIGNPGPSSKQKLLDVLSQ